MAIKGLSIPVFGEYVNNGGTVSYKNGVIGGKAINYNIQVNTSEDNSLYADNGVAEQAIGDFLSANLTLGTDGLDTKVSKFLLGLKEVKETVSGFDEPIITYVMDKNMKSRDVGFGIIEEHQKNGVTFYRAVVLTKVNMKIPSQAAETRGQNINWQTATIEGIAIRSEEVTEHLDKPWQKFADFDTEAKAIKYLMAVLNVESPLKALIVKSVAGTTQGTTKITVTPPKTGSNKYKYKIDTSVVEVVYSQLLDDWTDWDGVSDITATTGQTITVAEVDLSNKAVGSGSVKVSARA